MASSQENVFEETCILLSNLVESLKFPTFYVSVSDD